MKAKRHYSNEFTEFLAAKSQEFDEEILASLTPASMIIGAVECGRFIQRYDSVGIVQFWSPYNVSPDFNEPFDRFNEIFPDMTEEWNKRGEHKPRVYVV